MHWVFRQSCPVSCTFRTSQNISCTRFCSIGISVNLVATKSRCKVDSSIHKLVKSFGLNVTGLAVPFWTKNWRLVGIFDFCDITGVLMVYIPESWNPSLLARTEHCLASHKKRSLNVVHPYPMYPKYANLLTLELVQLIWCFNVDHNRQFRYCSVTQWHSCNTNWDKQVIVVCCLPRNFGFTRSLIHCAVERRISCVNRAVSSSSNTTETFPGKASGEIMIHQHQSGFTQYTCSSNIATPKVVYALKVT